MMATREPEITKKNTQEQAKEIADEASNLKQRSPRIKQQAVLKDASYMIGSFSRRSLEEAKKFLNSTAHKRIGNNLSSLANEIGNGWKNPKDFANTDIKTSLNTSSCGQIIGSATRHGTNWLNKTLKKTYRYLGKGYKKGRVAALIAMWKAENPSATKADKETAIDQIKKLYKL